MNRLAITLAAVFLMNASGPASAEFSTREDRREQCIDWMIGGYPSGLEEISCVSEFSLPSAFLFKCARAEKKGYRDELQRQACSSFFVRAAKTATNGYVKN